MLWKIESGLWKSTEYLWIIVRNYVERQRFFVEKFANKMWISYVCLWKNCGKWKVWMQRLKVV